MTCHTVSADGSTLVSGGDTLGGSYDLLKNKPVFDTGGAAGSAQKRLWSNPAVSPNGQYLIQNLLTGTYYMTASKFNYGGDNTSIQILGDETVVANFRLKPNEPATLGGYSGMVSDSLTNLPINGVLVEILTTSLTGTSDATGAFVISNIPPGT